LPNVYKSRRRTKGFDCAEEGNKGRYRAAEEGTSTEGTKEALYLELK